MYRRFSSPWISCRRPDSFMKTTPGRAGSFYPILQIASWANSHDTVIDIYSFSNVSNFILGHYFTLLGHQLVQYLIAVCAFASIYTLVLMSLDRFLAGQSFFFFNVTQSMSISSSLPFVINIRDHWLWIRRHAISMMSDIDPFVQSFIWSQMSIYLCCSYVLFCCMHAPACHNVSSCPDAFVTLDSKSLYQVSSEVPWGWSYSSFSLACSRVLSFLFKFLLCHW